MTSTIDSLHKILKDETRRKIILELNEKGSVSYTDLMESLGYCKYRNAKLSLESVRRLLEKDADGKIHIIRER